MRICGRDLSGCYGSQVPQRLLSKIYSCRIRSKSTGGDKSIQAEYDSAFLKLINEIEQKLIKEGRAYDMATLSGMYKRHLTDSGMDKVVGDTYKLQK